MSQCYSSVLILNEMTNNSFTVTKYYNKYINKIQDFSNTYTNIFTFQLKSLVFFKISISYNLQNNFGLFLNHNNII